MAQNNKNIKAKEIKPHVCPPDTILFMSLCPKKKNTEVFAGCMLKANFFHTCHPDR